MIATGCRSYIPPHFAESDLTKLHDFIESHSFGLLVSHGDEPFANLPFLLDRQGEPQCCLIGHMARANSQTTMETVDDRRNRRPQICAVRC